MNEPEKKKKKDKKKKKKEVRMVETVKFELHVESAADSESSEEELDLLTEIHPIGHYIQDRAEMVAQMFSVIKGKKLKAMLPPILKDYDLEKLKLKCLDQLLGMSEKRITSILEGELLESSSESDVASEESEESESEQSSDGSENAPSTVPSTQRKKNKSESETLPTEQPTAPEQGKTLLEILELEMRARAIRALLKQGESEVRSKGESGKARRSNEGGNNVVDLTDEGPEVVVKDEPFSGDEEGTVDKEKELREKLIRKKQYRTREQRMENIEPDVLPEPEDDPEVIAEEVEKKKPEEIVIDDEEEEGEICDEDETVIKEEAEKNTPQVVEEEPKHIEDERLIALDDGELVPDESHEWPQLMFADEIIEENGTSEMRCPKYPESSQEKSEVVHDEGKSIQEAEGFVNSISEEKNKENLHNLQTPPLYDIDSDDEIVFIDQDPDEPKINDEETTWRERWLQREKVQKLVKSSKICALVRKRLKTKKIAEKASLTPEHVVTPPAEISSPTPTAVEGRIDEYEKITGKKVLLTEEIVAQVLDDVIASIEREESGVSLEVVQEAATQEGSS